MIGTFCQNLIRSGQIVFPTHSTVINSLSNPDTRYLKCHQNQPSPSWLAPEPGQATLLWFQGRYPDSQVHKGWFNTRSHTRSRSNETLHCVLSLFMLKHAFLYMVTMEQNYLCIRGASMFWKEIWSQWNECLHNSFLFERKEKSIFVRNNIFQKKKKATTKTPKSPTHPKPQKIQHQQQNPLNKETTPPDQPTTKKKPT